MLSRFSHALYQGLSLIAGISVASTDYVPVKYKPLAIGIISLAQGIVALVHHEKDAPK
jgi:hypothetical protein